MRLRKRGSYTGRLAFDPDTECHIATDGRFVVTDDGGRSWRYKTKTDKAHNARYSTRTHVVSATTPDAPHHVSPTPDDPHYGNAIRFNTDDIGPTVTGHTEAWRND